jgi:hypothetical protein
MSLKSVLRIPFFWLVRYLCSAVKRSRIFDRLKIAAARGAKQARTASALSRSKAAWNLLKKPSFEPSPGKKAKLPTGFWFG